MENPNASLMKRFTHVGDLIGLYQLWYITHKVILNIVMSKLIGDISPKDVNITLWPENHVVALPKLKERVFELGFSEQDMFMALAWIRELSPILVHIDLDNVGNFLKNE